MYFDTTYPILNLIETTTLAILVSSFCHLTSAYDGEAVR